MRRDRDRHVHEVGQSVDGIGIRVGHQARSVPQEAVHVELHRRLLVHIAEVDLVGEPACRPGRRHRRRRGVAGPPLVMSIAVTSPLVRTAVAAAPPPPPIRLRRGRGVARAGVRSNPVTARSSIVAVATARPFTEVRVEDGRVVVVDRHVVPCRVVRSRIGWTARRSASTDQRVRSGGLGSSCAISAGSMAEFNARAELGVNGLHPRSTSSCSAAEYEPLPLWKVSPAPAAWVYTR